MQGGKVEDGAWLSLTGEEGSDGFPTCSTLVLDHPDTVDYAAGGTATFDTDNKEDQAVMNTCYKVGPSMEISYSTCAVYQTSSDLCFVYTA